MESDYDNISTMSKLIVQMKEWNQNMKSELPFTALEVFIEKLQKTSFTDKDSDTMKQTIKNLVNYDAALQILSKFGKLDELQKRFNNLNMGDSGVTIEKIVNESGVKELSKCLREKKVDWSTLSNLLEYIINVLKLTDEKSYNHMKTILRELSNMRKELIETETFVKDIASKAHKDDFHNESPLLQFKDSEKLSDHLGNGMRILKHLWRSLESREELLKSLTYGDKVNKYIQEKVPIEYVKKFWSNPRPKIEILLRELQELNSAAQTYINGDLMTIRKIFDEATKVQGIPDVFEYINENLDPKNTEHANAIKNSEGLKSLDMDFSEHKGDLNAASLSLDSINLFFEDFFELTPKKKS
uniref:WSN domain-containing protein n=1 Tax=Caenorhabditis tropicalis TaxID=1561998 RepID=A0A1I7U3H9_9PELO